MRVWALALIVWGACTPRVPSERIYFETGEEDDRPSDDRPRTGGDDKPSGVDPTNPTAISDALAIAGATRTAGSAPVSTTAGASPRASGAPSTGRVSPGATIWLGFDWEVDPPATTPRSGGAFVQVDGASSWWDLVGWDGAESGSAGGSVTFPVTVDDGVASGRFCLLYGVYDADDRVSNRLRTCLDVVGTAPCPTRISGTQEVVATRVRTGDTSGEAIVTLSAEGEGMALRVVADQAGASTEVPSSWRPCGDGERQASADRRVQASEASSTYTVHLAGCGPPAPSWVIETTCAEAPPDDVFPCCIGGAYFGCPTSSDAVTCLRDSDPVACTRDKTQDATCD